MEPLNSATTAFWMLLFRASKRSINRYGIIDVSMLHYCTPCKWMQDSNGLSIPCSCNHQITTLLQTTGQQCPALTDALHIDDLSSPCVECEHCGIAIPFTRIHLHLERCVALEQGREAFCAQESAKEHNRSNQYVLCCVFSHFVGFMSVRAHHHWHFIISHSSILHL